MQDFFRNNIAEARSWPYYEKDLVLSLLPQDVELNPDEPKMPYYTEINDNYIEFRRAAFWAVSGVVPMCFFLSLILSFALVIIIWSFVDSGFELELIPVDVPFLLIILVVLPKVIGMAFLSPHNLPVRFNRKKQKVYIASMTMQGSIFQIIPKVIFQEMDWSDVEGWGVHRRAGRGTSYFGLHLVEKKQDCRNPKQQVCLYRTGAPWSSSEMRAQINFIINIWSYCQHYMNYLPVPDETTKDENFVFLANNWLFKWPDAMDTEFRKTDESNTIHRRGSNQQ